MANLPVDNKMPKDTYAMLRWHMINAHNAFKCGFDSILEHLDKVPKNDVLNFLGYCHAWVEAVDSHHTSEELIVFPFLNQKLDFSNEKASHVVIHEGLDKMAVVIEAGKKSPKAFDPRELRGIMEGLHEPLFTHLDEEVEHIAPENLKVFNTSELAGMIKQMEVYAQNHGDPFVVVPWMRSHQTPEEKEEWPPMPWVVKKVVIPWVLAVRHRGYWKYSPYPTS